MFDLTGKRALVTGATGELGSHFAETLSASGAAVTLAARRVDMLEGLVQALRSQGRTAEAMFLDIGDAHAAQAILAEAGPFDIVVNNAGVSRPAKAVDITPADWDAVVDVNLKGSFFVAQAAARAMRAADKPGAIINVASIVGLRVAGDLASYAASKAGLIQLTKALALEWARHGIRVNALCPGYIKSDINREFFETDAGLALVKRIPQRRLGASADLDGPLLLLASDASAYMTGAVITVDGGHLVSSL